MGCGQGLGSGGKQRSVQPYPCCCAWTGSAPEAPLRGSCPSPREDGEAYDLRVQVGRLRLYDHDSLTNVTKIIRHPKFNQSLSAEGGADVALLKLEAPVTLSEHIGLVPLPPAWLKVPERKRCWVSGWGYSSLGGKLRETCWLCGAGRHRTAAGGVAMALLKILYSRQFGGALHLFIVANVHNNVPDGGKGQFRGVQRLQPVVQPSPPPSPELLLLTNAVGSP